MIEPKSMQGYKNHYEIAHIDKSKDRNPHIIIDTKNPVSVGDIIQLNKNSNHSREKYIVKSIIHYLRAVSDKEDEQYYIQDGAWNAILYVEDYK